MLFPKRLSKFILLHLKSNTCQCLNAFPHRDSGGSMEIWYDSHLRTRPPPPPPAPPSAIPASLELVFYQRCYQSNIYVHIIHDILPMISNSKTKFGMERVCIQSRLCYLYSIMLDDLWDAGNADLSLCEHQISKSNRWDKLARNFTKARRNTVCMCRICYGPSLCGPTSLCAEFAMGRVCYGPRYPVTLTMTLCIISEPL